MTPPTKQREAKKKAPQIQRGWENAAGLFWDAEFDDTQVPRDYFVSAVGEIVERAISQTLSEERRGLVEKICVLIDEIELQSETNTLEEWKQYKHIRNAIRDRYSTPQIQGWEKQFDVFRDSTGAAHYQIKDFVRDLLAQTLSEERRALVEKIKQMKTLKTRGGFPDCGDHNGLSECCQYETIDNILSALQEKEEK